VKPNTLAVIGCIQPYGSLLPVSELQTRWAIAVMKGETTLPTEKEMQTDVEKRRLEMAGRYLNSPRHAFQVEWIDYMDEIARMIDCKPDWVKLLTKDPRLALSVVFGPCIPSQYRLMGKGAWPDARNTVLTTWKRILEPMNKKGVHQSGNQSVAILPMLLGLLLVVACVVLYMS
jgi:dimethylaniline monooxygenase (N-oxide forming)